MGDAVVKSAVAKALQESFPYVRVFRALDGRGFHFLASNQPIASRTSQELAERMPVKAATDLVEWGPAPTPGDMFGIVLRQDLSLEQLIRDAPEVPALQDDRPENEYYVLRQGVPAPWLSRLSVPH
jgi:hypothetical protein